MADQYDNIPHEMRVLNQFCVWKLEERGGAKPTKPLYRLDGRKASVNNPQDLCSFNEAVAVLRSEENQFDGLGFVFQESDNFAGIDIDATTDEANRELQTKVWNAFPSYTERSPSGLGYHIIVKGSLPCGRRRMSVEVYSSARFFTMTGDLVRDLPIIDCQDHLDILWQEMSKGNRPDPYFETFDGEQIRADDDIIKIAASAANKEKFNRLNEGNFDGYPSQSEADQAYINMLSFYTDSKTQVARLFLASPLGQREKAWKHPSYLRNSIHKSFDRKVPPIDLSVVQDRLKQLVSARRDQTLGPDNDPVPWPPGLLHDIADFIYKQSPRPVHDIALVGAIGLLAGICGQAYNISGSGLNHYVVLIARTGTGKESIASGINKIMGPVIERIPHAQNYIGPSDMASGAGLTKWLENSSCFFSVMGEIGHRLAAVCNPNAPTHEISLKTLLLDLYQKSGFGQILYPKAYSTKTLKEHVPVARPSFTLIGESTPERFFDVLDDSLVSDGFLPRFLIFQYDGDRKYLSKDFSTVQPSENLIQRICEVATHCREIVDGRRVEVVRLDPAAEQLLDEFDRWTSDRINDRALDGKFAELYNRAHMKALRLAGLVSVGINQHFPLVTTEIADWSIRVILRDINNMMFRFKSGETGIKREGNQMEHVQIIRGILKGWFSKETKGESYGLTEAMIKEGAFSTAALNVRLANNKAFKADRRGVPASIKDALKIMQEDGEVQEIIKIEMQNRFGKSCLAYQIVSLDRFQ